jgi:hypothetical protein
MIMNECIARVQPYDKAKYDRIISACALGPDLAILPSGDSSEIGRRETCFLFCANPFDAK